MRNLWPFKVRTNFQTQSVIVIIGNGLNKGIGRKVAILAIVITKNTLKSVIMIMGLLEEKCETPFKTPKPFLLIQNFIKTLLPTLKKDLLPFICSLKFLERFLEIGLNASGNNLGAGFS